MISGDYMIDDSSVFLKNNNETNAAFMRVRFRFLRLKYFHE